MISSRRADLISRSSKLQMYPDVWIGSWKFMKRNNNNNNKRNKYEKSPSVQQQKLQADLWVQVSEDVHPGLLHHGKQVRIVVGPLHVPNILAFKLGRISCRRLASPGLVRGGPGLQVQQGHHSRDVDDGQTTKENNVFTLPSAPHTGTRTRREREDSTLTSCCSWGTGGEVCCLKCISGSEPRLADCICARCLIYAPANTHKCSSCQGYGKAFQWNWRKNVHVPLRGSYLWLSHSK